MQTTLTKPRRSRAIGIRHSKIQGSFVPVTVHQFAMAYWLMHAKHITPRQFRLYLAAFEIAEWRRHAGEGTRACYTIDDFHRLVGGQGTGLASDLRKLEKLGLLCFSERALEIAISIDQIHLEDINGFWSMYSKIKNNARTIPVPRRWLRALAKGEGFAGKSLMACAIAMLMRGLYWQRQQRDYRIDGRVKQSLVADIFQIDARSVRNGINALIDLGWISKIRCTQPELNAWGQRYELHVDWQPPANDVSRAFNQVAAEDTGYVTAGEGGQERKPCDPVAPADTNDPPLDMSGSWTELIDASEVSDFSADSASNSTSFSAPYKQDPLSLRERSKYQKAHRSRPSGQLGDDPRSGVSRTNDFIQEGQEGKAGRKRKPSSPPRITDVQPGDLRDTSRLLELYKQAVGQGRIVDSEARRLEFVALAERAMQQGSSPAAMFIWLLNNNCFDRITQAQEDAARRRLHSLFEGPNDIRQCDHEAKQERQRLLLTEDERMVQACLQAARNSRFEAYDLAHEAKGWTRQQWDEALDAYNTRQFRRWQVDDEG